MKKIVNRLIQCILTLFIVSVLCFALTKAAPGDPVLTYVEPNMSEEYIQNLRESLGLTKPVYEQYFLWLGRILHGNFGNSLMNNRPVLTQMLERLPATVILMGTSMLLGFLIAIVLGLYSGKNKNGVLDKITSMFCYVETDCKLLCAVVTASKGFVRESVGDNVSEDRVDVITAAYSLVGKVGYFWGGKSTVIGEDPSWGSVEKVSADGSRSSGTLRAYGLDCSGFVTWAVINGYKDQGMQAAVGDGTSDQWEKAGVVSEADAQPGDLVFQRGPEAGSNNHVGILCGKTDSGDWIAVHCSSSKNGVTVGEAYSASFRYIRKPSFYQDTTAEENKTTATENDVLTEESAEKLLTDVVRSDALKDALASGDTVSSDLLADFKNKALQEDEEEDEVETLTLDQETMDDAVDTFDDDVETLEMEN